MPGSLGDVGHISARPLASVYPSVYRSRDPKFLFPYLHLLGSPQAATGLDHVHTGPSMDKEY